MNLVFDFGAVLVTWLPGQLLLQTFPDRLSTQSQAAQLAKQVFGHPDWHAFDRGELAMDEVAARTAQRLDLPHPQMHQLVHGIGERLTPMADTVALLAQLRQRRLAGEGVMGLYYLSNMPVAYARILEQRFEFLQWFDGGIFSGDVKHIKPDPAIYHLLQSRHALEPKTTVFIDDLAANVEAARALGWHGIHFESAQQLQTQLDLLV